MLSYPGICQAAFFGKFYIFRALATTDEYTFSMFDPWRHLLKMGCTTWPEDPSFGRSECHAWSCAPNYEMMTSILGVSASSPGCKSLIIKPRCGNLRWAKGIIPIPQGEVKISWRKENSHFSLKAEIPEGTTALVILPDGSQHSIKSGRSELKC